jgi:hypothetical protein
MNKTKKYCLLLGVLVVILAQALIVNAAATTVTGKLTGLTCLVQGYLCPIDKADPMIGLEKDFVLVTAKGDYYFLSNLSLGIKARHALETVEVTGEVNAKYKTIQVDTLKVGGKLSWSHEAEKEMMKNLKMVTP